MRKTSTFAAFIVILATSSTAAADWAQLDRAGICHAMHFVDGTTGYAIHGGSIIDGNTLQKWNGSQWTSLSTTGWAKGTLTGQSRLFFVDANIGFSAQSGSALTAFLQRTSNGGLNWTSKTLTMANAPASPEAKVEGISFANASDGVAIGWVSQQFSPTNGKIMVAVTHDGGEAWSTVPAPSDATYLYGGAMLGPDHIVAYGYVTSVNDGGIWITRNAGATWTKARPGNRPVALDFLSATVGYAWITCAGPGAGALDKCISKTTNGGETWTDIQTGFVVNSVSAMKFADENHGIIATGKTVYETNNGGTTWTEDPLPNALAGNTACIAYPGPAAFVGAVNGADRWHRDATHGGGPKANLPGAPPASQPDAGPGNPSNPGGSSSGDASPGGGSAPGSLVDGGAPSGNSNSTPAPTTDDGGCTFTGQSSSLGLSAAPLFVVLGLALRRRRPRASS